jgi:hypothetical protein
MPRDGSNIEVACVCGGTHRFLARYAGRIAICPLLKKRFLVPSASGTIDFLKDVRDSAAAAHVSIGAPPDEADRGTAKSARYVYGLAILISILPIGIMTAVALKNFCLKRPVASQVDGTLVKPGYQRNNNDLVYEGRGVDGHVLGTIQTDTSKSVLLQTGDLVPARIIYVAFNGQAGIAEHQLAASFELRSGDGYLTCSSLLPARAPDSIRGFGLVFPDGQHVAPSPISVVRAFTQPQIVNPPQYGGGTIRPKSGSYFLIVQARMTNRLLVMGSPSGETGFAALNIEPADFMLWGHPGNAGESARCISEKGLGCAGRLAEFVSDMNASRDISAVWAIPLTTRLDGLTFIYKDKIVVPLSRING